MKIMTHKKIDQSICGTPVIVEPGFSRVELKISANMVVDQYGLVHGGFIFGLADYAAMIAVNHPNVVLGGAESQFLKPVVVSDTVTADAHVEKVEGKKHFVRVSVSSGDVVVFQGSFLCFVLEKHLLDEA